jgi:dTDP-4-dehydrorhamnose reductase
MRGKNFLLMVLPLAQERDELRIVADQHGAPTWCRTIADTTANIVALAKGAENPPEWRQQRSGVYNLTAQGQTRWYGFTQAILENSIIAKKPLLTPITTQDYLLPAKRPTHSSLPYERLMHTFCGLPEWEKALRLCQER